MVKGLKSMWRQAAPVVRRTLHGCLLRILMQARACACGSPSRAAVSDLWGVVLVVKAVLSFCQSKDCHSNKMKYVGCLLVQTHAACFYMRQKPC